MKSKEFFKNTRTYGFILSVPHFKVRYKRSVEALPISGSFWCVVIVRDPVNPEQ